MTCIKRAGSSHRTLLIAAGDVETMEDLVHTSIKLVYLEEKSTY